MRAPRESVRTARGCGRAAAPPFSCDLSHGFQGSRGDPGHRPALDEDVTNRELQSACFPVAAHATVRRGEGSWIVEGGERDRVASPIQWSRPTGRRRFDDASVGGHRPGPLGEETLAPALGVPDADGDAARTRGRRRAGRFLRHRLARERNLAPPRRVSGRRPGRRGSRSGKPQRRVRQRPAHAPTLRSSSVTSFVAANGLASW